MMKFRLGVIAVLATTALGVQAPGTKPARTPARKHATLGAPDTVWFWFAACGGPSMTLELRLDNHPVYTSDFPVCRAPRNSPYSQGGEARIALRLTPQRAMIWKGYRDEDDTTRAREPVEADVWEAGADSDVLLLGVSLSTVDRIVMNTIHIAHPGSPDTTRIADGLVVLTYPTKPRK